MKKRIGIVKAIFFSFFAFLGRFPFALVVGGVANYYVYSSSLFLLNIRQGATIRPMFEGAFTGIILTTAVLIGVPLAIGEIYRSAQNRRRLGLALGLIGLILCLSASKVSDYFWNYYAMQRGITFEE